MPVPVSMPIGRAEVARHVAAWVLAIVISVVPWIALRFVPVEVNKWSSIYIGGALGGLALELLLGRGRVELPAPSVASAAEQRHDERRPLGPLLDLGFLARVASSGLAATALLLVYHAMVDHTSTIIAFNKVADDPSTFGWAIFVGASSPAIWTASQQLVKSRVDALTAANKAELHQQRQLLQHAHAQLATVASGTSAPAAAIAGAPTAANKKTSTDLAAVNRAYGILEAGLR